MPWATPDALEPLPVFGFSSCGAVLRLALNPTTSVGTTVALEAASGLDEGSSPLLDPQGGEALVRPVQEAVPVSHRDCLGPGVHAELPEDALDVRSDGLPGDV